MRSYNEIWKERVFQMNTIAERIKFAMRAKNKKQVDIVKDTGISKGAFSSYLSGQYNPKADKMELIAVTRLSWLIFRLSNGSRP